MAHDIFWRGNFFVFLEIIVPTRTRLFEKKQIGDMAVVSRGGPSGKLSKSGLRSKIFAQEAPRKYWWAERGLCPGLPVRGFSKKKQIGVMSVVSRGGPSGKLSKSGLRSKIFAQEAPRVKYRAEPGLCPALPVAVYIYIAGSAIHPA